MCSMITGAGQVQIRVLRLASQSPLTLAQMCEEQNVFLTDISKTWIFHISMS
jgi:hypothetical protein